MNQPDSLNRALAQLSGEETLRLLDALLTEERVRSPGGRAGAFEAARHRLPPVKLISCPPPKVAKSLSEPLWRDAEALHQAVSAGVTRLRSNLVPPARTSAPAAQRPLTPPPAATAVRRNPWPVLGLVLLAALLAAASYELAQTHSLAAELTQATDRMRRDAEELASAKAALDSQSATVARLREPAQATRRAQNEHQDLTGKQNQLSAELAQKKAERARLETLKTDLDKTNAAREAAKADLARLDNALQQARAALAPLERQAVAVLPPTPQPPKALKDETSRLPDSATALSPEQRKAAEAAALPAAFENSIGMRFVLIPPGEFMMGSPDTENDRSRDEGPVHRVRITQPFYLAIHEVTQRQYEAVMGTNPSGFKGPENPVEQVSWNDAQDFCKKLSQKEGKTYRFPTEAEWEYACRAGTQTRFSYGDDPNYDRLREYAWYTSNSDGKTHPVGEKKPNAWALFDMHGNVWEWCEDWYDEKYYGSSDPRDPKGPSSGRSRVLRGGSWGDIPRHCRSADRGRVEPEIRYSGDGFRVVCAPRPSNP